MKALILALTLALTGVATMSGCSVTDKQSSAGEYIDDAYITSRVKARFAEDKQVSAMRINVETLNGEVQLSGFGASEAEKARAAEVARSVPNVKTVRNNIIVRKAEDDKK